MQILVGKSNNNNNNTKIYNAHIVKHLSMNQRRGQSPGAQTECANC